ncbi:MAG: hypothetical protein AAGC70_08755 [Pseudomonadota bacterium]
MRHMIRALAAFLAITTAMAASANAKFLSPDTMDPTVAGVGTNRYAYSGNNPINNSDPNGHLFDAPEGSGDVGAGWDSYVGQDQDGKIQDLGSDRFGHFAGWDQDFMLGTKIRRDKKGYFDAEVPANLPPSDKIASVAGTFAGAKGKYTEFGYGGTVTTPFGTWARNTNKCNCFVGTVLDLAGQPVPNVFYGREIPASIRSITGLGHAPSAAGWAAGNFMNYSPIPGKGYRPGDIVAARGINFTTATGHTGIVTATDGRGNITQSVGAEASGVKAGQFGSPSFQKRRAKTFRGWGGARRK